MQIKDSDNVEYALNAINNLEITNSENFMSWVSDPENKKLYEELLLYKEAMLYHKAYETISVNKAWEDFSKTHNVKHKELYKTWISVAISVVIVILGALFIYINQFGYFGENIGSVIPEYIKKNESSEITIQIDNNTPVSINTTNEIEMTNQNVKLSNTIDKNAADTVHMYTLSIPRGKFYHIVLEDKTEVWLNTDSKLIYPSHFNSDKRIVELIGEAYFKVAKDGSRPFIIESEFITAEVTGTELCIRTYGETNSRVALVEGQVSVRSHNMKNSITLQPGEVAFLNSNHIIETKYEDIRKYTSWVEGYFYFDNMPLSDIMKEIGRWYNVNISFEDEETKHFMFKFWAKREDSIEETVKLLNQLKKVNIDYDNNYLTIQAK